MSLHKTQKAKKTTSFQKGLFAGSVGHKSQEDVREVIWEPRGKLKYSKSGDVNRYDTWDRKWGQLSNVGLACE